MTFEFSLPRSFCNCLIFKFVFQLVSLLTEMDVPYDSVEESGRDMAPGLQLPARRVCSVCWRGTYTPIAISESQVQVAIRTDHRVRAG